MILMMLILHLMISYELVLMVYRKYRLLPFILNYRLIKARVLKILTELLLYSLARLIFNFYHLT